MLIFEGPRQQYILLHVGVEGIGCGQGEIRESMMNYE